MTTHAALISCAVEDLKYLQVGLDARVNHEEADLILCRVLTDMGMQEIVDEWKKVKKWYA